MSDLLLIYFRHVFYSRFLPYCLSTRGYNRLLFFLLISLLRLFYLIPTLYCVHHYYRCWQLVHELQYVLLLSSFFLWFCLLSSIFFFLWYCCICFSSGYSQNSLCFIYITLLFCHFIQNFFFLFVFCTFLFASDCLMFFIAVKAIFSSAFVVISDGTLTAGTLFYPGRDWT